MTAISIFILAAMNVVSLFLIFKLIEKNKLDKHKIDQDIQEYKLQSRLLADSNLETDMREHEKIIMKIMMRRYGNIKF